MKFGLKTASITLALMAMVPGAAQAAPSSEIKNLGETPGYLATDAQGNAWVAIGGMNETVARVKPSGNVKKFEVPYPMAHAPKVWEIYEVPYQPVTIVIGADGAMAQRINGPVTYEDLREVIEEVL